MGANVWATAARYFIICSVLFPVGADAAAAASYDFSYRLSGDRRVAPVQVFDDGSTTWLQFPPGQTLPAVFVAEADGDTGAVLASYTQQGPYLVLAGTTRALVMRIGDISARADYTGKAARTGLRGADAQLPTQWREAPSLAPAATLAPVPVSAPPEIRNRAPLPQGSAERLSPTSVAIASAVPAAAPALEFDASLSDQNMRLVLDRWARQAGWMFGPEHWTVDVDIPLVGAAAFGADFRNAVRSLLGATELADHPVQPCFYSNRVLRVVPLAQACDRTAAPMGIEVPRS